MALDQRQAALVEVSLHRICCGQCTAEPRMVRAGWYSFLVLDSAGSVMSIVGSPQELKDDVADLYSTDDSCVDLGTTTGPMCMGQTIPIEAPAGHPLATPSGVKCAAYPNAQGVKDICCGAYHNIVRMQDNTIKAWGLNSMGQCNVPTSSSKGDLTDPNNVNLKKIVGLHAGYSNSAVSFNDGTVVCWGDPQVADVVNSWTDLMMSPINHLPENGNAAWNDLNNVATDGSPAKTHYAKPAYPAAYNTSEQLETWNLASDPMFAWHSAGNETHCMPFFDLGVEVDPFAPLDVYSEYSGWSVGTWNTVYPGWPQDAAAYCDVDGVTNPNGDAWKRWLDQRWRNHAFGWSQQGWRSCCDMEVKSDFAVALRRTGQLITTRATNRKTTGTSINPACPTGYTDGRSHCRDCSADALVTIDNVTMPNFRAGCGSVGSACSQQGCNCCLQNTVGNCPDCSGQTCAADQRFITPTAPDTSGGFGACRTLFFEGIGCMSTVPLQEDAFYDEEWATPDAGGTAGGGLQYRWVAGQQVRYVSSSIYYPSANQVIQSNFGWSTLPSADTALVPGFPAVKCLAVHNTETPCNKLCKSHVDYENVGIDPQGVPQYNYPTQMRAQFVAAGTDTVSWNHQAIGFGDEGFSQECSVCPTWPLEPACRVFYLQSINPNGGDVTYSVIFAGEDVAGGITSLDKYGERNSYVSPYGGSLGNTQSCSIANKVYVLENYFAPSKPWGPMHLVMWNSVGHEPRQLGLYPICHCCPGDTPARLAPPYLLRVVGASPELDSSLGLYNGFPWESGMFCETSESSGNQICKADCSSNLTYQNGAVVGLRSDFTTPFCANHPPRSYASSRLAFAMVRADHRDCDRDANGDCILDANGKPVRANPLGKCNCSPPFDPTDTSHSKDGSQFFGCTQPTASTPSEPVLRAKQMLHIWGSLWDPCPPWPRHCVCDGADVPAAEADYPFDNTFTPRAGGDYTGPCYGDHPESSAPLPENDPNDAAYGLLHYPSWTRQASALRRAWKGRWVSGSWMYDSPTQDEPAGPDTRYCPNCDEWQQDYGVGE